MDCLAKRCALPGGWRTFLLAGLGALSLCAAAQNPPPTLNSISPSTGPASGGTAVLLTGTNFLSGATVLLAGNPAGNVVVMDQGTITALTPANPAGPADVTVINPDGQSATLPGGYLYNPGPSLSSVSPASGPLAGGTSVTLAGANFLTGASVTFGNSTATNVVVVNGTTITANTPPGSAGAVNVAVTNPDGQTATLVGSYTYIPPPSLASVVPAAGPIAGGTGVTLTGANFVAGATVSFGSNAATNVAVVNASTITVNTPAGAAGLVDVTVTNPDGQFSTLANAYTYNPAPSLNSITPSAGPAAGGTTISLSGTNFQTGATLTIGGNAATNVVVGSTTTITATTPPGGAGAVDVTVMNPDNQAATLRNGYTYNPGPSLTSVSPAYGPLAGGTAVTLTGFNFVAGATVMFGTNSAANVVVINATTITAATPAGAAGAVNVTVTNPDGQTSTLTNGYTYNPPPSLSSISPAMGSSNGGTAVTISGANFLNGATVSFGSTPLTNVAVTAANTITATTPPNPPGLVNVTVTNPDGQSVTATVVQAPLTNTGFESGSSGWSASGSSSKVITNATLAHSGSNFAQLTSAPGNHPTFAAVNGTSSQYFPVSPGNVVTFGGWIARVSGDGFVRWVLQVTDVNKASPTYISSANVTAGAWTLSQKTYTVPTGKAYMRFYCEIYNNTVTAQANFDDAILQQQVGPALYTYLPLPTVTTVSPNSGPTIGGTSVTITGSNFVNGANVGFGVAAATNVKVVNSGSITASTPPSAAGAVNVTVTNPDGDVATANNGFTYFAPPPPVLSSISPTTGSTNGGTTVTLVGSGFLAGATVTFGGVSASATFVNSGTITAVTPANPAGAVNVTVTNPDGQFSTLNSAYSYIAAPSIPQSFFGLHFHNPKNVPGVSYGTCRIWGVAGANWAQLESQPGVFNFTALDQELADAKQAGISDGCVFTFGPTPPWASPNPTDNTCSVSPGGCWLPTDLNFDGTGTDQTIINAITAIASHVNDPTYLQTHAHILYWEPWNEAYRGTLITGTVCSTSHLCSYNGSYAQLVRIAEDLRSVIKGIDPTALITTPSGNVYFQTNGQLVVANFLNCAHNPRAGSGCTTGVRGSNAVDVVNTHCYVWDQNADDVVGYLRSMKALLSPADAGKPFLCDEGGWATNSNTPDPDVQAGFVARWFTEIATQNVAFAGWYAWDDSSWGTLWNPQGKNGCTMSGGCLTKGGVAYQQVNSWLVGATLGSCTISGGVTTCPLSRPGGYQAEIAWVNTALTSCSGQPSAEVCGSTAYPVPAAYITKCDLAGVCQPAQSTETIGAKPLLFANQ